MRDIKNNLNVVQSLVPAARTATANGVGADLRGYDGAMAVVDIGAVSGTTPSFTFALEESADDSAYAAVATTDLQGAFSAVTSSNQAQRVGYVGAKRYVRVAITAVSGTSPAANCAATIVRGRAAQRPVA
ncbi:MAG: hypothetical protein ACREER_11335 [Alphaproteobacteria bacterium]